MLLDWRLQWPKTSEIIAIALLSLQASMLVITILVNNYNKPMKVEAKHIYGTYRVDIDKFDRLQATWQHEHFELTISTDNYLRLYQLKPQKRMLDEVRFEILDYANAKRIKLRTTRDSHHILRTQPTLFREPRSFFYVFESEYYGNMFFRKVTD
jgi:hypothetical protein